MLKTEYKNGNIKAVVSVPGWVEELGKEGRSAGDPVSAWSSVPLLYRAVNLRCQSLSTVPYVIFKGNEEAEWPLENEFQSVIYNTELSLMLSGVAYLLKLYEGRTLTGVQWLNPTTMTWEIKNGENIYTQKINNVEYGPWDDSEMISFREPSMASDVGPGIPPARVALTAAKLRFNMDDFVANFFANGAQPMSLITTTGTPSQAEMDRAQSFFKRSVSGVANAWRAIFLRGDIRVETLTPDLDTMEMPELSQHVVLDIAAALGIPRSVLESDAANYATSQTDMKSFWEQTIRPRLPMYETAINEKLFGDSVEKYSCKFTPENLEIFQVDEAERSASLLQLVNAGVPLVDAMAMLGYDPLENVPEPPAPEVIYVTQPQEEEPSPGVQDNAAEEMRAWQKYATTNLKKKEPANSTRNSYQEKSQKQSKKNSNRQRRRKKSN